MLSAEIAFWQIHWSHLLALLLGRKDLGISTFIDKSTSGNETLIWFVWREWIIDFFFFNCKSPTFQDHSIPMPLVYRLGNWVNRFAQGHRWLMVEHKAEPRSRDVQSGILFPISGLWSWAPAHEWASLIRNVWIWHCSVTSKSLSVMTVCRWPRSNYKVRLGKKALQSMLTFWPWHRTLRRASGTIPKIMQETPVPTRIY